MIIMNDIQQLQNEVRELRQLLALVLEAVNVRPKMISVQGIADKLGVSYMTVKKSPWLLPNWGRTDTTTSQMKWKPETVDEWFKPGMQYRQVEWKNMEPAKKARIRSQLRL